MSTVKEKLAKLKDVAKQLLAFAEAEPAPVTDPLELAEGEYKLADGTIVKCASLEVGQPVTLVTAEGEVPAPKGEHTLEDGRTLVIGEDGTIADILELVGEIEMSEATPENLEKLFADYEKRMEAKFSAMLEDKDEKITAIEKANKVLIEQNKKQALAFSALLDAVQEMGESTPAPISEQKSAPKEKDPLGYFKKQN
jgi:hypothetical protein